MRAITLATAFVIALAVIATPTQAADRTVQAADDDRELEALAAWIVDLERVWIAVASAGGAGLVAWTPVPVIVGPEPVDREPPATTSNDRKARVILEDGAPF